MLFIFNYNGKKECSIDTCYNMNKHYKHFSEKNSIQKRPL